MENFQEFGFQNSSRKKKGPNQPRPAWVNVMPAGVVSEPSTRAPTRTPTMPKEGNSSSPASSADTDTGGYYWRRFENCLV